MNRRLALLGVMLTALLAVVGCVLIIGGLFAAFVVFSSPTAKSSTPTDTGGAQLLVPTGAVRVGGVAPDFSLRGLDQQTLRLSQFHGKAVLLNFWATWCGPCSAEMPNIEAVFHSLSSNDVEILAVNQGEFGDQVKGYADLYHLHFPILLDSHTQIGNMYHVQALPTTVFVDRTGIIREIHIGGPMSQDFLQAHIKSLLAQSP